jgi:pyruvate-ferredoxin/flavodoxin oxidoreductase
MAQVSKITWTPIKPFDYNGQPNAESVIVLMGSTAQNVKDAGDFRNRSGSRFGVIKVHLFRPFTAEFLC